MHVNSNLGGTLGDVGGHLLKFEVEAAVGGEERGIAWAVGAAGKVTNTAAGLFHQQNARGGVPGSQAEFPEGVEAATGNGAKIERGGTIAADAVGTERVGPVIIYVLALSDFVDGKAGGKKAGGKFFDG